MNAITFRPELDLGQFPRLPTRRLPFNPKILAKVLCALGLMALGFWTGESAGDVKLVTAYQDFRNGACLTQNTAGATKQLATVCTVYWTGRAEK